MYVYIIIIKTFKILSCQGNGVSFQFLPAPGSLRQKDSKFQDSLGYIVSLKPGLHS